MSTEGASEALTAEETAFLNGSGDLPITDPETPTTETAPAATADAAPKDDKPQGQDGDDPEGTIVIDETGRAKDRRTGRYVPVGALHKERETRKALASENEGLKTTLARVNERLSILSQAFQPADAGPTEQAKPPPKPEEDIFGYAKYLGDQLTALQSKYDTDIKTQGQRIDASEAANAYVADARSFAQSKPDFGDAYKHLVESLDRELQFRGWDNRQQRLAEIARLEREEVAAARKVGRRPAEWIYSIAQMRGYQAKSNSGEAGKAETQVEQKPATSAADDKLAQIERGQNAARSLSAAGGNAPAELTAEALANMSEAEFSAVLAKMGGTPNAALRKLLGQ